MSQEGSTKNKTTEALFTKEQLVIAYRKAKVDLYYATNPPLLEIADYEENLDKNLDALLNKINSKGTGWIKENGFLGGWTVAPKSFRTNSSNNNVVVEDSKFSESLRNSISGEAIAEFRIMAKCSLDFYIVSSLWIMLVGEKLEKKLSKSSYGSRLRRTKVGEFNLEALGSFGPYFPAFKKWRTDAIVAMQDALRKNKRICTITADVSSFYHEIDAEFLDKKKFLSVFGDTDEDVFINQSHKKIHNIFTKALKQWADSTPLKRGLPVGLPASSVVANLALFELDKYIEQEFAPLHYGRYVDDIFLVFDNSKNVRTLNEAWDFVFPKRAKNLVTVDNEQVQYRPSYLEKSNIIFENSKNKLFILGGAKGLSLINTINNQIMERASEWRELPILPEDPEISAQSVLKAISKQGDYVDNLRKADELTFQRLTFSITLRNYESFARDLHPNAWQKQRYTFFDAILEHLFQPKWFFDLQTYMPRIVRLATTCRDFIYIQKLFSALVTLIDSVYSEPVEVRLKAFPEKPERNKILDKWKLETCSNFIIQFIAAFPTHLNDDKYKRWKKIDLSKIFDPAWTNGSGFFGIIPDVHKDLLGFYTDRIKELALKLFSFDLAATPLRYISYPKVLLENNPLPNLKNLVVGTIEFEDRTTNLKTGLACLADVLKLDKDSLPSGFLFPTRPFNVHELYLVDQERMLNEPETLNKIMIFLRGFQWSSKQPHYVSKNLLHVSDNKSAQIKPKIAVASWKVTEDDFIRAARHENNLSLRRYNRLKHLVNRVISDFKNPDYLILPELAIPATWFVFISKRLKQQGISLISGVEYIHSKAQMVSNQAWFSLVHDGLGFTSSLIYRQDKQQPAIGEENQLKEINNLVLQPENSWNKPPVLCHNGFYFSLLVCSELTNINYRAYLSGKIDALLVLEWNQDVNGFNALVEASALDLHAYIIQCNNRLYGDSRIRAPYKDEWKRDVLRVKGGVSDYYVIGEIDIEALRDFQRYHRPPEKGQFKPKPDGYEQADWRK